MPKVDIWMPIYIGDYLRDTQDLSAEEHGVYLLLLMHYWQRKGEIGSDIDRLARVCKTQTETARFILGNFFELVDGRYKNKRADTEIANAAIRHNAAVENGKKGGRPSSNNPEKSYGLAKPKAKHNPEESSSPSSSPSEEREEKKEDAHVSKPGGKRIDEHIKTWNGLGLPTYRYTSLNMREKDRADSLRTLSVYGDEEIAAAIHNYSEISNSSEHEAFPIYPTFAGFLATGIEKYADDAKPFDRCRKKGAAGKSEGALASRSDAWGPDDVARQRGEKEAAEAPTLEDLAELDRIKREAAKTPLGRAVVSMLGDG